MQSAAEFEQACHDLIHGKVAHIPRMNAYCILQQMKTVHDSWLPFKETVDSVFMGGITEGVLLSLDKAQWDKGVDPMFAKITSVFDSCNSGQGTRTQSWKFCDLPAVRSSSQDRRLSARSASTCQF